MLNWVSDRTLRSVEKDSKSEQGIMVGGSSNPRAMACVLVAEVGSVLAAMRCNARWAGGFDDPLIKGLKELRRKAFSWITHPWGSINPCHYLAPFLEVVRSDETGAFITGAALSAVYKILISHVFDASTAHAREAMHAIVESVTSCRFEVTDPGSEEAVLMKILQVLVACMKSAMGGLLSHRDVCNIVSTCFRVVHQSGSKSELLQSAARHTMDELIRVIFSHLCDFDPFPEDSSLFPKGNDNSSRNGSMDINDPNSSIVLVDLGPVGNGIADLRKVDFNSEAERLASLASANFALSKSVKIRKLSSSSSLKAGKAPTVDDTQMLDEDPQLTEPYGIACIVEIVDFLCSLMGIIDSYNFGQNYIVNNDDLSQFALGLINSALESGGQSFGHHPKLLSIVQDDLFRNLMQMSMSYNPILVSMVCSTVLKLYHTVNRHIKLQLEAFFLFVVIRHAQGKFGASYQQQEVATEALVDFCHQAQFMPEMYANFDCNIGCSNIFENLVSLLSRSSFPVNGPLSANHILALEGLLAVIYSMADRTDVLPAGSSKVASISEPSLHAPFWNLKCEDEKDPVCVAEFLRRQKYIKRQLMLGADHFNRDPRKGFQFLQSVHLFPDDLDPKSVAYFLRYVTGLDKNVVGDFLGDHDGFALLVLAEFTKTFDFSNISLDAALRIFLEYFRLPGEAQKIGRIVDVFAERYYEQCPEVLASKDAAFLLSYSVILLNTDQHNSQVKKRMTEEDFIRNLRAANGNEDFPREMLKEIYQSVVRDEIRISYDSGAGVSEMTLSRWLDLVHRSKKVAPYISCESQSLLDRDMFTIMSGPSIAAISVVFDNSEDESNLHACVDGFLAVAKIAAYYHREDIIDDLVVSLCKFTTLLNPISSFEGPFIAFAEDAKANIACRTVFTIANRFGDFIRTGWRNILDCIFQLHKLGLLPARLVIDSVDDHEGAGSELSQSKIPYGVHSAPPLASSGSKRRSAGLMSRFSQLLLLESEEDRSNPTEREVAAHQLALQTIENCHIDSIFSDSKFLQADSLLQLATAIISAAGRLHKAHMSAEDEDLAVFGLELLITVTLNNRDRIMLLWQSINDHLAGIVQISTVPGALVEKAVFGLLRICKRLLPYKEDLADDLLRSLQLILKLDARVADVFYERITQEVLQLVRANAGHIRSLVGWRTITSLLTITARHPEAAGYGFEALHFVMHEGAHLTLANYILWLDTALAFAESRLGNIERSVQALDLLAESTDALVRWSEFVSKETESSSEGRENFVKLSEELPQMWLKLLLTLQKVCVDQREDVRNHAIFSLQQSVLAADHMQVPQLIWVQCFDQVIFVLLDDMLEIALRYSPKEFRGMDWTLQHSLKLMSKVFLHFLDQLILLANFRALWLALLGRMEMYMKARIRGKGSEKVQELIPELLKNMLLIMHARGVLVYQSSPLRDSLWELTWHHVDGISPGLQSELFPVQQSVPLAEPMNQVEQPIAGDNSSVIVSSSDTDRATSTDMLITTDPVPVPSVQTSEADTAINKIEAAK